MIKESITALGSNGVGSDLLHLCRYCSSGPGAGCHVVGLVAHGDALRADVNVRPGDEPQTARTRLAAEGARPVGGLAARAAPATAAGMDVALQFLLDLRDADTEPDEDTAGPRPGVEDHGGQQVLGADRLLPGLAGNRLGAADGVPGLVRQRRRIGSGLAADGEHVSRSGPRRVRARAALLEDCRR